MDVMADTTSGTADFEVLLARVSELEAQGHAAQQLLQQDLAELEAVRGRKGQVAGILETVEPLMRDAQRAIHAITTQHLDEVRALHMPPGILQRAMAVVHLVVECDRFPRGSDLAAVDWSAARRMLTPEFVQRVGKYDVQALTRCTHIMDWIAEHHLGLQRDAQVPHRPLALSPRRRSEGSSTGPGSVTSGRMRCVQTCHWRPAGEMVLSRNWPRPKGHSVIPAPAPPELSRNVLRPACDSVGPCSVPSCLSRQTLVASLVALLNGGQGPPGWCWSGFLKLKLSDWGPAANLAKNLANS